MKAETETLLNRAYNATMELPLVQRKDDILENWVPILLTAIAQRDLTSEEFKAWLRDFLLIQGIEDIREAPQDSVILFSNLDSLNYSFMRKSFLAISLIDSHLSEFKPDHIRSFLIAACHENENDPRTLQFMLDGADLLPEEERGDFFVKEILSFALKNAEKLSVFDCVRLLEHLDDEQKRDWLERTLIPTILAYADSKYYNSDSELILHQRIIKQLPERYGRANYCHEVVIPNFLRAVEGQKLGRKKLPKWLNFIERNQRKRADRDMARERLGLIYEGTHVGRDFKIVCGPPHPVPLAISAGKAHAINERLGRELSYLGSEAENVAESLRKIAETRQALHPL